MARNTREDILGMQLLMLEAFTDAAHWLGTTDLQKILDRRRAPTDLRLIQYYCKTFVNMGLIVVHPDDTKPRTQNIRYRKSGTIAVVWSN